MAIDMTVNGKAVQVNSAPDTPLLYVLRGELGLTGTKFGCGLQQCGACSVITASGSTRTCTTPVSSFAGQQVTTVEGLPGLWASEQHGKDQGTKGKDKKDQDADLHPVQQAWIQEQVPQCGYCQNGMMITAAALLSSNPDPSADDIVAAFTTAPPSAHLCRCGTYDWIIKAVQRAARLIAEAAKQS